MALDTINSYMSDGKAHVNFAPFSYHLQKACMCGIDESVLLKAKTSSTRLEVRSRVVSLDRLCHPALINAGMLLEALIRGAIGGDQIVALAILLVSTTMMRFIVLAMLHAQCMEFILPQL